jgi:hypothetical protein
VYAADIPPASYVAGLRLGFGVFQVV